MKLEPSADAMELHSRSDLLSNLQLYGKLLLSAANTEEGFDPAVVGPLHYHMGQAHDGLNRHVDAEVHYQAAAHSLAQVDMPQQEAQCWLLLGEVQAYLGFLDAEESFKRAAVLGDRLQNPPLQAQARFNIGRLKGSQFDLEGALADYQAALRLIGIAEYPAAHALRSKISDGIAFVQTELIVKQTLELADQINRSAETPAMAPEDAGIAPSILPLELPLPVGSPKAARLPIETRASQGNRSWWPPWR